MNLTQINAKYNKLVSRRENYIEQLGDEERKLRQSKQQLKRATEALQLIQKAAQETQQQLEYHISNIVTLALTTVFDESYGFIARFIIRRNSTECDLLLTKDGQEMSPMDAVGGGVIDIISFALRIAYWSMKPNRPVFILDEPFRFLSVDLQERASEMIKTISSELGLQIIMVSHLPNIIGSADKIFNVKQIKGKSQMEEV